MMNERSIIQSMKEDSRTIFYAGIDAVKPENAITRYMGIEKESLWIGDYEYPFRRYRRIFVIGVGKACGAMAISVENMLKDHIHKGIVVIKSPFHSPFKKIEAFCSSHPVPDEKSIKAALKIIRLLSLADKSDLILFLVSGGGSSLVALPTPPITIEEKRQTVVELLACGASIHEVNTIRKHISDVKGGKLAEKSFPARMASLILSDVINDALDVIASGLTVPDPSTFLDCKKIIDHYGLGNKIPGIVLNHIEMGIRGKVAETPKPGNPIFRFMQNLIIGNNHRAIKAAEKKAKELGYNCLVLSSSIKGETKDAAFFHSAIAKDILLSDMAISKPACVISGGETTVTVRGKGLGGRNMEFALSAAIDISGMHTIVCLSAGSDGTDGPTDASGAFSDSTTCERAKKHGMHPEDYLRANDSYHFFESLNDLFLTGPTHTNVMDLRIFLIR